MEKMFTSAPLPFQGQKRRHVKAFASIVQKKNAPLYVDLFGGSGLLSHVAKRTCPEATVIYNDYDNFCERLSNVARTNILIADIRAIIADTPRMHAITGERRKRIINRLCEEHETGHAVDCITLSASILFSCNYYVLFEDFIKQSFYNKIRKDDFNVDGYLNGLTVVHEDYHTVYERYRNEPDVVFIVDPPYLATDSSTYKSDGYWKLGNYLDVLHTLRGEYIYFTSEKSQIVELTAWMEHNHGVVNPFAGARRQEVNTFATHTACYTDIMLHNLVA
jgi:site-specific DNA-adenine methylase